MNRFKRFCLLLCCSLVCLNGFLPVVSYAYTEKENVYPLLFENTAIQLNDINDSPIYTEQLSPDDKGIYNLSNPDTTGIGYIKIWESSSEKGGIFPFNPEAYDYYLIGTVTGRTDDRTKSTFKPTDMHYTAYDVNTDSTELYPISNLNVYDIDSDYHMGFGFYAKVNFLIRDNIAFRSLNMFGDKDGTGNKPANLNMQFAIMAVDKSGSEEYALSQILTQLLDMEQSINGSISTSASEIKNALNEVNKTLEDQYAVDESDDFGVTDIVDQVNEKAGVLSFGTDTLVNFLDLFDAANATNTKLTFPGFAMKVQGVDYQVWPDYEYDLSELENQFGVLIEVVRWGCVMVVWLAVLNYLVKAYDTIFGR